MKKQIPGYKDLYYITHKGDVFSLEKQIQYKNYNGKLVTYILPEKKLKPYVRKDGRIMISLYDDMGQKKNYFYSRLMYSIWNNKKYSSLKSIHYIDGNPLNCCLGNLTENIEYHKNKKSNQKK